MSKKQYIFPSVDVMEVKSAEMMTFTDPSNGTPKEAGDSSSAPARRGNVF